MDKEQMKLNKDKWQKIFKQSTVLIMIGQIFLNALRRAYLKLDDICLIIFDECHHTIKDHPYNKIMQEFYLKKLEKNKKQKENQIVALPRILGLSASPIQRIEVKRKDLQYLIDHIDYELLELCVNLNSNYGVYDH